jgi:hypothetical protein
MIERLEADADVLISHNLLTFVSNERARLKAPGPI